jgi:agmatine deiminase
LQRRLVIRILLVGFVAGCLAVPVFHRSSDDAALRTIEGFFPGRRVVPVPCHELIRGRGGLHCITRDQPAWPA